MNDFSFETLFCDRKLESIKDLTDQKDHLKGFPTTRLFQKIMIAMYL